MAKGQISDKELQSSIRTIGSLAGIASSGAKRDSPFGSDFARKVIPSSQPIASPSIPTPERADESQSSLTETLAPPFPTHPGPTRARRVTKVTAKEDGEISKTSIWSEKVTLQMTPEMRDDLNQLATRLQRRKATKEQRITANTVMRVAIQFLLDELKLNSSDIANTEDELLALMKRKILVETK